MDRVIWRIRKAWSRTLGRESGLSWATRLVVSAEITISAILLIVLWMKPVDWQTFWPSDSGSLRTAMPWGYWLVAYLVASNLLGHGICVLLKKRWALVLLGLMCLIVALAPFVSALVNIMQGASAELNISSFSWLYLYSLVVQDAWCALRVKTELQSTKHERLEATPPPKWIT